MVTDTRTSFAEATRCTAFKRDSILFLLKKIKTLSEVSSTYKTKQSHINYQTRRRKNVNIVFGKWLSVNLLIVIGTLSPFVSG